ncbi:MAG: GTP pyrophosphokinase family protein [Levilactobacillus sp.]|uniref:GTP pyrophosphokinase family protein n=1 Tax=Levilactobacillus suantsaiihabitans TaxID=2487722 RepID=A0A4Z0JAS6_9LACO|nr:MULTISPECIES: GTP pyrophosphokinase family protein [Levilactobacillus]MCI1553358.1 GTP pyrophosphokinase family protein [Levilactobacillus sp.]MCI1599576.1 GTP pyrophosphokinase family protein [Levilactobacillus sp.]MCI1606965.1 GTP pyrophosphokinase family protein [Levilactobacillus sp.]TGD19801.1 GTP pyrophosphokinase family protein [Levilactobacillus suantsaiihabitans]
MTEQNLPVKFPNDPTSLKALDNFRTLMLNYRSAVQVVETKIHYLDQEYQIQHGHTLVDSLQSRIKSPESILEKAQRKHLDFNFESLPEQMHDIAGIRIIVRFEDDILAMERRLEKQPDIKVLKRKDYVAKPKPNGYRSLHLILAVPVYLSAGVQAVTVEVQIRTIAMNFWASLEHELSYKKNVRHQDELRRELIAKAELVHQLDQDMNGIKNQIRAEENQ